VLVLPLALVELVVPEQELLLMVHLAQMVLLAIPAKFIYSIHNMYIYFNKTNNEVKMTSDKKIKVDPKIFGELKMRKSDINLKKMNFKYITKVKGKRLIHIEKPPSFEEQRKNFQKDIEKAQTLDEVKQIIKQNHAKIY
jgi:hypothetical protein